MQKKNLNLKNRLLFLGISFLIWGTPLLFFSTNNHFVQFFGSFHLTFSSWLFEGVFQYSVQGILFEIFVVSALLQVFFSKNFFLEKTREFEIFLGFKKLVSAFFCGKTKKNELEKNEKTSVLFWLVKFIFLPLLIHFSHQNLSNVFGVWQRLPHDFSLFFDTQTFLFFTYPFLFYLFLTIDTFYFVFGYLVESTFLNNRVRSVDETFSGWFFALVCYPPYNLLSSQFFGWYSSDFSIHPSLQWGYYLALFSIICFFIYLLATISLGAKCSNMTNRGIVSSGVYAIVRHPAYISKNLAWWVMGIPFILQFGLIAILSLSSWTLVYYARAMTEERHLSLDPEYQKYQKKVPWKFIPGVL